ncbi:MAG: hypothetical protein H7263_10185 [Candidatus Sericytochromatia bacterium]|nr:hypothetical protein [Candidatus Sericytochromatia bacterium]
MNIIEGQIKQIPGVTGVTISGQYAQGARDSSVCGLLVSTSANSDAQVRTQARLLEQQYNTNYSICVNTYQP